MDVSVQNRPVVYYTPEVGQRIDAYIGLYDKEISGLGTVKRNGMSFLIDSVVLPEQVVTAGSTDIDEDWLGQYMLELVNQGVGLEDVRLWWHSHVNGSCGWSGTDKTTVLTQFDCDWTVSIVGNRKGDRLARVDFYNLPEFGHITFDDVPLKLYLPKTTGFEAEIRKEIADKVTVKVPPKPEDEDEWIYEIDGELIPFPKGVHITGKGVRRVRGSSAR